MNRGIIYTIWYEGSETEENYTGKNENMDKLLVELEYSTKWVRREGYPIRVYVENPHDVQDVGNGQWPLGLRKYYDTLSSFLSDEEIVFYDYPAKYHLEWRPDPDLSGVQKNRVHPYWYNRFHRRHYIFRLCEFDQFLCLDSDCFVMNSTNHKIPGYPRGSENISEVIKFDYVFNKLDEGFAFASAPEGPPYCYNKLTTIRNGKEVLVQERWDDLCQKWLGDKFTGFLPLLQGGVNFVDKTSKWFIPTMNLSEEIMLEEYHISACEFHQGHTCNDQVTLSLATEKLGVPVFQLNPNIWCLRDVRNPPFMIWPGVKIVHSQDWFWKWKERYDNF